MKTESLVWIGVSLIILFLVWLTVKPLISPIIFGLAMAYIFHPFHMKLSENFGNKKSAILLTAMMALLAGILLIGAALWLRDVLTYLYIYIGDVFNWLLGVNLPFGIGESIQTISKTIPEKLGSILLGYTFSLPKFMLQAIVFLALFYAILTNSDFLSMEIYRLLPKEKRELGIHLVERAKMTLNAILRTWLMLSVLKGVFLTVGFVLFDITTVSGAIAAGILCIVLELLPVIGGWILWVIGAAYLIKTGNVTLGVLFAVYGAVFISPIPDITIRPKLVAEGAKVSSVVALIGIFGGIMSFGIKGVIIGPVALGLLVTLLEEWKEQEKGTLGQESTQPSKARHSKAA
ncbi:MAG: AI-2E family transporter [Thermococcus sp.]|uniref:AI-2E family transporter n=1 Tax=Thermococcus sp. TaxID=35749 RepID=UPI001D7F0F69|nr:AI-2E family transporter [Thermococcus sp.]MBO8174651.1 AI-2E family transporter [Thermococcus sp.]